jgi:hypothetical protein
MDKFTMVIPNHMLKTEAVAPYDIREFTYKEKGFLSFTPCLCNCIPHG